MARDVPIPEGRQSSVRLEGDEQSVRHVWDKAVCADANKLSQLAIPFRPTGNQAKPAINCRSATKFLLERMDSTLPDFPLQDIHPLMNKGRSGAKHLHEVFTAHYHGTTTPANDGIAPKPTPAQRALKRAML